MRLSVAGGRFSDVVFMGLYFRGDVGGDWVDSEYVFTLPA
jgi:hypothetical protein